MKLAVVFPGIGYNVDKPLLYYAKKLAKENEYEILDVPYKNFPANVKGNPKLMEQVFLSALEQSQDILKDVKWDEYESVLFIMKSVGTAVGAAYAKDNKIKADMLIYTPVEQTFQFLEQECGIVFSGTNDPWVEEYIVKENCSKLKLPLHMIKDANHSLEMGDLGTDIVMLHEIMRLSSEYISK